MEKGIHLFVRIRIDFYYTHIICNLRNTPPMYLRIKCSQSGLSVVSRVRPNKRDLIQASIARNIKKLMIVLIQNLFEFTCRRYLHYAFYVSKEFFMNCS